jgi:hypothetical protein
VSEEMTPIVEPSADEQLAKELVERARSEGAQLVGPGGLLTDLTKTVLETALEVEMEDHLGYAKHAPVGRDKGNSRNGTRSKTVLTEVGEAGSLRIWLPARLLAALQIPRCATCAASAEGAWDSRGPTASKHARFPARKDRVRQVLRVRVVLVDDRVDAVVLVGLELHRPLADQLRFAFARVGRDQDQLDPRIRLARQERQPARLSPAVLALQSHQVLSAVRVELRPRRLLLYDLGGCQSSGSPGTLFSVISTISSLRRVTLR